MPETNGKGAAIRKRQQIENANRTMFIWVAVAAAIIGLVAVLSISMYDRIAFNNKVLSKKNETIGILKSNNTAVEELERNVRVRNTNQALLDTPRLDGSEPLSVILDALPSKPNSSALGASLQQKLLNGSDINLESLLVNPISGVEDKDDESSDSSSDTPAGENEITFSFVISTSSTGGPQRLKDTLLKLERSIRVIDLTSVTIEQQSSKITLSAEGRAYYLPETKVELKEESVKP